MKPADFLLTDQVAIVTGSSRGIGRGVALALAAAGSDVVLAARNPDDLASVQEEIGELGRRSVAVEADLSRQGAIEGLVTAGLDAFGRIDTVVNNVGGTTPAVISDLTREQFERAISFNVTTAFDLTKAAMPSLLVSPNASVINISSAAGTQPIRGFVAYGTAKAAMNAMTKNLAQDLAPKVRVNAIAPGLIETSASAPFLAIPEYGDNAIAAIPMRRFGQPGDVAGAAVFLASPAASYVTGVILPVNGGVERPVLDLPFPDL